MEVVIIILALVYSVWSELQKKKQEEDVNVDFTELTTLDDFFKKPAGSGSVANADFEGAAAKARPAKKSHKQANSGGAKSNQVAGASKGRQKRAEVNYDELPGLSGQNSESAFGRVEVNYDEMPSLGGKSYESGSGRAAVNYDELPTLTGRTNYEAEHRAEEEEKRVDDLADEAQNPGRSFSGHFAINREDLLKTFVLSEVLQPYNINRIYDRIPGIKPDN